MTSSNQAKTNLVNVLQEFSKNYLSQYQKTHSHLPMVEQDNDWPSICEVANKEGKVEDSLLDGHVFWQPVEINKTQELNFENVESALDLMLHPDVKTYFTTLYSESLHATCEEGELSLLFAWNKNDFQRLQENVIGHILMKQRLKQKETIFFAVTDEEDVIISVDNATGTVWVERVGCEPHKKIADTLALFIAKLTPKVQ